MDCTGAAAKLSDNFATLMAWVPSCKKHEHKEEKTVETILAEPCYHSHVHGLEARLLYSTDGARAIKNANLRQPALRHWCGSRSWGQ